MSLRRTVLAALLIATVLAGCATTSPVTHYYTLVSASEPVPAVKGAPFTVALAPVSVPEAIDRPQIVTRTGNNELGIDDFERWAEPLKQQIPRVVAAQLTRLLDGAYVYTDSESAGIDADCTVTMDVQAFDSVLGDAASAEIVWNVRCPKRGLSQSGRTVSREPATGPGYAGLVAAHEKGLAKLSRDIAEALRAARDR